MLACLALAGLALTHYRVLIFALLFIPALLTFSARRETVGRLLARAAAICLGAGLLFLPWGARVFGGKLVQIFGRQAITPAGQVSAFIEQYNAVGSLAPFLPLPVWILLILAAGWGLWRRERDTALVTLWFGLVLLAANPGWLGLPGAGLLSNFAVLIAAYLPAGLLIGAGVGWGVEEVTGCRLKGESWKEGGPEGWMRGAPIHPAFHLVLLIATLGLGLQGARSRLRDPDIAGHALATRPDLRAFAWIQANTPPAGTFLVNAFPAYGNSLIAGSDGGWWLPLLTGRASTLPPLIYGTERGPRLDYAAWTNQLEAEVREKGLEDPGVLALLRERGVSHIYIGQRQGQVGADRPPLLDPHELVQNEHFRPVYHEDRVWIFELIE
jgi:hypothetical protein